MTKGTPSMGRKVGVKHTTCRRCGRVSFHIQHGECSACGFGIRKKIMNSRIKTHDIRRLRKL